MVNVWCKQCVFMSNIYRLLAKNKGLGMSLHIQANKCNNHSMWAINFQLSVLNTHRNKEFAVFEQIFVNY